MSIGRLLVSDVAAAQVAAAGGAGGCRASARPAVRLALFAKACSLTAPSYNDPPMRYHLAMMLAFMAEVELERERAAEESK